MRRLLLLVAVAAALVAADLGAKSYAEGKVAERLESAVAGDQQAEATIDSFPFLGRLLLAGSAGDLRARLDVVRADGLTFSSVEVRLDGVRVDRDLLFQREVEVTGIDSGVVTADLEASAISDALGITVAIRDGVVEAKVGGRSVTADASVVENRLRLGVGPLPELTVPIPRTSLVPCATSAVVIEQRIRITCTIQEVPPALLRVANEAGAGS